MPNKIMPLADAIARNVRDGQTLSMEGFTHLIPFAAGHEVIRQRRTGLTLVRMTPDIIYDQLIGMGCAKALQFSWGGNPGVGSIHRFRDAIENGWPHPLAIEEHSHADMAGRYQAGASGLPFSVLRGYVGSDLPKHNGNIRSITCPFTGEKLAATPAITPDLTVIHAQRADREGNVMIHGIVGIQKEAVLAAKSAIVTVEEIVDDLRAPSPNSVVLPYWTISAIAHAPGGARPSYAHGYYGRDNPFYLAWDAISKDRESFRAWMDKHVMGTKTHAEFMKSIGLDSRLRGNDKVANA